MNEIEFILKFKDCLSISGIEKKLGMPHNTLKNTMRMNKPIPKKHQGKISELFDLPVPRKQPPVRQKKTPTKNVDSVRKPVGSPDWVKEDNMSRYKNLKNGKYERDGKLYETKFDGGFWVREVLS